MDYLITFLEGLMEHLYPRACCPCCLFTFPILQGRIRGKTEKKPPAECIGVLYLDLP